MSDKPPEDHSQDGKGTPLSAPAPLSAAAPAVESPWIASPWARIKEHKLAQWTLAYAAFVYALLHGATLMSDALEWPHAIVRVLTLVLVAGLPIAPVLAWYHGVRALKRVSGSELILITVLLVIGGSLLWLYPHPAAERAAPAMVSKVTTPMAAPVSAPAVFAPPARSIAVLPFVNMSGDVKQEYFSDGISEELLNSLSRLNDLQVAARTSSFSFKGKDVDISTIARKLNVGAVLEGSVRRARNTVRITVQLINAVTGFHIWSQTYDRNLTDILKLQAEVATAIAQQLEVKLVGNEAAKFELGGTKSAAAYDAYLRALQLDTQQADPQKVLAAFDHVISLDPNFASAYARRAGVLLRIYDLTSDVNERPRLNEEARAAAERAVALAPQLGEAHLALAFSRAFGAPDFAGVSAELDRALALAPGSAWVQRYYALYASELGHFEAAVTAARRAVSLDPQNVWSHFTLAVVLHNAHRYREALAVSEDARALDPASHITEGNFADSLLASGQFEKAQKECESPSTPMEEDDRHACMAVVYHSLGRQDDAKRELEKLIALDGDSVAAEIAGIYAQLGNKAAALQWLTKAEQQYDSGLQSLKIDWTLDPIRNEPQFKAIEKRMNFPP